MTVDAFDRPLRSLRLSVTDRCNLRCVYCMPEREYVWLPKPSILTFAELERVVSCFTALGVDRLRLTGGEPLLRHDLDVLVRALAGNPGLRDIAVTTNAVLMPEQAESLRDAGLRRVTVSLDTLQRDRSRRLTGRDMLARTLRGIDATVAAGFDAVKLNTVVMRGHNHDELADLIAFGRERGIEVRFIEYMDVGGASEWHRELVVSRAEILTRLEARLGPIRPASSDDSAPADRFELDDGTVFGIISSTTQPFCSACDRSRVTADGTWFTCLYATAGTDLRRPLREGATDQQLQELIRARWSGRDDRGAEDRMRLAQRSAQPSVKHQPHLEMHTRGG